MVLDVFIQDAIKEINNRLNIFSVLKGVTNFKRELTEYYNDASYKYGLNEREKTQLKEEIYRIYNIRI